MQAADPVNFSDPFGLCPQCIAYGIFEIGASIYDAADLAVTGVKYLRGKASGAELSITAASAAAGVVGFGGGYGAAGRAALRAADWAPAAFRAGELDKHFAKHAAEWGAGNITKGGYLNRARSLLSKQPGGDILGHTRADGDVLRYNTRTNEFAVGTADGTIRTLFRPENGMNYWRQQVRQ